MGVRIGGVQPGYLPWLGYFDQMRRVDAFVIADEMRYSSSGWVHRNRVKGPRGAHWLTLPVRSHLGQRIDEVRLDRRAPWARKHLDTLRHFYARGADAGATLDRLEEVLDPSAESVSTVATASLRFLAEQMDVRTPILVSSELQLERRYRERFPEQPGPTHRIVAYMEALGATELLGGESAQSYFDVPLFESFGMRVTFHRYQHPRYPQLHSGPFLSHLSALDLLLCAGAAQAKRVLGAEGRHADE